MAGGERERAVQQSLPILGENCHQKCRDFDVCIEVPTSVQVGAVQPC